MKKKGFTLIELLAVIVILAIIALIAVPVIMNIISKARENAFKDTMYGIVKAGELYYAGELLTEDGMTEDVTFTFSEDGVSPSGLNIKGSLPTSGSMTVTKEGKIILNATDGVHTATKEEDSEEIKVVKKDDVEETPEAPIEKTLSELAKTNDFATTVPACAAAGTTCTTGEKFAIEVAPGNIQNFYVVSDADNKVTLIMDRNIDEETVAWISEEDYGCGEVGDMCSTHEKGPITALNYLESKTSSWTNIEAKTYTLEDDNEPKLYSDITRTNARARMLTVTEALAVGCTGYYSGSSVTCPNWLYENLRPKNYISYGYWLSSACADDTDNNDRVDEAWLMYFDGRVRSMKVYDDFDDYFYGVRPVIEISK